MAISRKWDNELFDIELKKVKSNWVRVGDVVNAGQTVVTLCERGHEKKIQPSAIKNIKECRKCTIEDKRIEFGNLFMEDLIKENYTPEFSASDYIRNTTLLPVVCPSGSLWKTTLVDFNSKYKIRCRCDKCLDKKGQSIKISKRRNGAVAMLDLLEKGFKINPSDWNGTRHPLVGEWVDCGHTGEYIPVGVLSKNTRCRICRGGYDFKTFSEVVEQIAPGYKVVDQQKYSYKEKILILCDQGHEIFVTPQSFLTLKNHCRKCLNKNKSGKNSFLYNDGLGEEHRKQRSQSGYKHWVKAVKNRDSHTCRICKSKANVIAHHLYGFTEYKEIANVVENGISLCFECHSEFHIEYGYGNNTIEQFLDHLSKMNNNSALLNQINEYKSILYSLIEKEDACV